MSLRSSGSFLAAIASLVAATAGAACAEPAVAYRPGQFFTMDLGRAALSTIPLGPVGSFARPTTSATTVQSDLAGASSVAARAAEAPSAAAIDRKAATTSRKPSLSATSAGQRPGRLASTGRRALDPLDAQARMTKPKPRAKTPPVQSWPCRSGGICAWRSPAD